MPILGKALGQMEGTEEEVVFFSPKDAGSPTRKILGTGGAQFVFYTDGTGSDSLGEDNASDDKRYCQPWIW